MKNTITFLLLLGLSAAVSAQTDTEPPTLVCKQNIVHVSITPTGTVSILADHALYDTLYDNVSTNISLRIRKACTGSDFPQGGIKANYAQSGQYAVEVWARDEAGNTASCLTHISVDEGGIFDRKRLQVTTGTEACDGVEEAHIELRGNLCGYDSFVYQETPWGPDCCIWAPEPGASFSLKVDKDDNPLNGVTTYDLVLIARHIQIGRASCRERV